MRNVGEHLYEEVKTILKYKNEVIDLQFGKILIQAII